MLDKRANWIIGTPDQAHAQLEALAGAGIDRALISVNSDLHREMLPLLAA
jgi:alkanesulfonate monooxygenase SsuD/methylene tetrahydromethanopterin reductase-like flavin-dependent oxidoreductase (luciferase family)